MALPSNSDQGKGDGDRDGFNRKNYGNTLDKIYGVKCPKCKKKEVNGRCDCDKNNTNIRSVKNPNKVIT